MNNLRATREAEVLKAVERLKNSNFQATGLKVELEANIRRYENEGTCLDYILEAVAEKIGADYDQSRRDYDDDGEVYCHAPLPGVTYARFYNDGSVDSELTFTISLDDPKNVLMLPVFLDAFKQMANEYGHEFDIDGAGMHMALINTPDCHYPSRPDGIQEMNFHNFRKSMKLLLPAMYFLGTHNEQSRPLEWRKPDITESAAAHGYEKASAIGFNRGAIEFRVFDTCYDKPDAIYDNIQVMANSMKYWKPYFVSPGLEKITTSVSFGHDNSYKLDRFYSTLEHIDLLNMGLMRLKPEYLSLRDLKAERGFKISRNAIANREKVITKESELAYQEYSERFDWGLTAQRYEYISNLIRRNHTNNPDKIEEFSKEAEAYVRSLSRNKTPMSIFISERLNEYMRNLRGEYQLDFND